MSTPVLALHNLRIVVTVIVVTVRAVMAYPGSSTACSSIPFRWRSIRVVDPERWFGFDFFFGFQDICLILLLFFLSGRLFDRAWCEAVAAYSGVIASCGSALRGAASRWLAGSAARS